MENVDYEKMFEVDLIPYDFHRAGRRTKCTAQLIQEIGVRIARDGCTHKDAALLSGIDESVFYRWMARGRKESIRLIALGVEDDEKELANPDELPFLQLFDVVSRAVPLRKSLLVQRIRIASKDPRNWTAAAWLLERLHADEFGRKTRLEISKVPWQEEVLELIRSGMPFDIVAEKIGDRQARQLFERAGVESPRAGTGDEPDSSG